MIISRKLAIKLLKSGKAANKSFVWDSGVNHELSQPSYISIDRFDVQIVCHYVPSKKDLQEWINS